MKVKAWRLSGETPFGRRILAVIRSMALKQGLLAPDFLRDEVAWCRNRTVVLPAKIMPVTAMPKGVGRTAWQKQDQHAGKAKEGNFH
jgi:hypothetical protein